MDNMRYNRPKRARTAARNTERIGRLYSSDTIDSPRRKKPLKERSDRPGEIKQCVVCTRAVVFSQ